MGHQTLKPYKSCSCGHQWLCLGPWFCKTWTWACGKEGLSPPGPVSLPGAALEYSRLGILCCTELAVLKSFSFLKALCAQGFASILKHPRMHQVNSPSQILLGACAAKKLLRTVVTGGKPFNTHYRQSVHELENVLPHLLPGILSSILSWLGQQLCSVVGAAGEEIWGEKPALTKTSSGSCSERSWRAGKHLKASVTFPFTGSNGFYLLVVKRAKTEELLIPSQEGEMAEEFLVVNCLQLFYVQGKVVRCKRR